MLQAASSTFAIPYANCYINWRKESRRKQQRIEGFDVRKWIALGSCLLSKFEGEFYDQWRKHSRSFGQCVNVFYPFTDLKIYANWFRRDCRPVLPEELK